MTGTFAPRPGSAPLGQQVRAQAGMELRLMLRNGEHLLLALAIPVLVLVGAVAGSRRLGLTFAHPAVDVFTPGVFALAIVSTAFTSVAIATGFERSYGLIKRLGASPLPRHGLLLGKTLAVLAILALQMAVLSCVAWGLGWSPRGGWLAALALLVVGTTACAAWGLFLAGTLRAEATLAAANLVYLLLMTAGAVVLPSGTYGGWGRVAQWLPSGALGDGLRAALLDGVMDWSSLAALAAWALVGAALTARTFSWE
jgi:ABC-2 type transport system permease protein